jgi:signal transduction histidine kinase/DNA-binding NarL/FixJ family response regulator
MLLERLEATPRDGYTNVGECLERRYVGLVGLARRLSSTRDWSELAAAAAQALDPGAEAAVRLFGITADGLSELSRAPSDRELPGVPGLELSRAARLSEPIQGPEGTSLIGLHADGVTLGVLQTGGVEDHELMEAVAPLITCRFSVLAGQGVGGVLFAPEAVEQASDASSVISDFARYAKRQLDHDRLSVYLLTHDGRAFERFAVVTSPIVPGEGILIPFEDVGLKHIILTNEPLVSSDISADPRIVGREDRVIAQAGFRGLLSVPLRRNGRPFGVLNFVSRTPGFYRQEDIPVAEQIGSQIGVFVENLRLQRRMQTLVRQEASERERARLARDLYHTVAQAVREIEQAASELERQLEQDKMPSEGAQRIRELAQLELAGMRRALIDIDPVDLDTHTLEEVVETALERFREPGGPDPRLRLRGDTSVLSPAVQRETYRVLQEALMNARLHAEATIVEVKLSIERNLTLLVEDDGRGFDVAAATRASEGLGLRHMRDRTEALGGFLTIQSKAGEGTSVKLVVPGVRELLKPASLDPQEMQAGFEDEGTLRVLVAERDALLRAGLCRLVEHSPQMRIVAEASSIEQVCREARELHPDVIVLSTALANGDLRSMIATVRKESPSSAVLVMSELGAGGDTEIVQAGANGIIHPPIDEARFAVAVRAVAEGTRVVAGSERKASDADASEGLSERERSVLALVAAGQTNAQIGRKLYLATKTVERQVATIVRKLAARNRSHAAAIAVARRIVQLPDDDAALGGDPQRTRAWGAGPESG